MNSVKVSERFQVVIPKHVRGKLGLRPGLTLQVLQKGGTIILVPEVPLSSMEGILKGMDSTGVREKTNRKGPASQSDHS